MNYDTLRTNIETGWYNNKVDYPDSILKKAEPGIWKQLFREYHEGGNKAEQEFREDCRKAFENEIGFALKDTAWITIMYHVWDQGHSSGYSEVLNYLIDMESLVREVINGRA